MLDLKPDLILIYHGTNEVHARLVDPASYSGDNSGRRRLWGAGQTPLILRSNLVRLLTGINPESYLSHFVDTDTTAAYTLQSGFSERLNATPLEALEANEPVYFERNLRNMIAIAREHDIDVLLATWAYSDEIGDYASTPHYGQGFAEINDVIRNVGLTHDVPVYDFAAEMPMAKEYWADGVHVNEAGARRMGELFAGFMDTHDLPGDRKT